MRYVDQGRGTTILLVHGFPLDHQMWKHQIHKFADSYRVIAPDLIGFGGSNPFVEDEISISQMADELAELLDKLHLDQVVFCGLSMGGYIGWKFWERHAEKLIAMVACDTRVIDDTAEIARGRRILASRLLDRDASDLELSRRVELFAETLLPKLFCSRTREKKPTLIEKTRQIICSTSPHSIALGQIAMANRESFESRLSQIDIPMLVVAGVEDVITPSTEMEEFANAISGAQFSEIPGGHLAPLEEPELFNAELATFLTRIHSG